MKAALGGRTHRGLFDGCPTVQGINQRIENQEFRQSAEFLVLQERIAVFLARVRYHYPNGLSRRRRVQMRPGRRCPNTMDLGL